MSNVKEFSVEEKLTSLVTLQKIESKLDEYKILKGELPMEVSDLEDEIQGLHSRQTRVEEEINGIQEFINSKKEAIKEAEALIKKYEKQSENVKNNREFEAINKEVEMQQLEVKLCEKHIKDANEEIAEKAQVEDTYIHMIKPYVVSKSKDIDRNLRKIRSTFEELLEEKKLVQDNSAYYLYEQIYPNKQVFRGLLGLASIEDFWNGKIKRHESTIPQ